LDYFHCILLLIDAKMTRFRPCIDLHSGQVKQIVGGTLSSTNAAALKTNYISKHSAKYFAGLYRDHDCHGAHVIMLGPGNEEAAREALAAWPGGLQVGGGITDQNAGEWIGRGAEKVTVCYYVDFPRFSSLCA
jgi:phosphoribosylformimino-5-aminoimidazole carboxamide ribotide isomerase